MPLNMRKPSREFGAEGMQPSVLQAGVLYTKNGKRIPHEVPPELMERTFVPPHLRHIVNAQINTPLDAPPPPPEVELDFSPTLADLRQSDFDLLAELEDLGQPITAPAMIEKGGLGIRTVEPAQDEGPTKIGR